MKQTTRKCSKRLLSMLMAIALLFFNVKVASAVEITESDISVESDNSFESTDFVSGKDSVIVADTGDTGSTAPSKGESETAEDAEIPDPSKFRLDSFVVPDVPAPTSYTEVYERIIAWKDIIPTGTPGLDAKAPYRYILDRTCYTSKGTNNNSITTFWGCAAFAFILSDAAFGTLPAKTIGRGNFKFEDIRVGDILWINHYVIVLQTNADGVIIAEANNDGKVYWGRSLSIGEVMRSMFMVTRYPDRFGSEDEENSNFVENITVRVDPHKRIEIVVPDVPAPTSYTEVYERITVWRDTIPTGTSPVEYFGDHTTYTFNVLLNDYTKITFQGSTAFAFILSDAAFGKSPAKAFYMEGFPFEYVRVGDILHINDNGHMNNVIVLQTNADGVIVAEVNDDGIVNWERILSAEEVACAICIITRYPEGFVSNDDSNNSVSDSNPETGISANRDLLITVMITALAILAIAGVPWFKPFKRKLRIKS